MSHGKKFTAAEKHFNEKKVVLEKRIKARDELIIEQSLKVKTLTNRVNELEAQNAQLQDWVNRLLEYTELSEDDIKKACEKDQQIASLFGFLNNTSILTKFI